MLAAAERRGTGVFEHEGRMIDGPILRHARSLATRGLAGALGPQGPADPHAADHS